MNKNAHALTWAHTTGGFQPNLQAQFSLANFVTVDRLAFTFSRPSHSPVR